MTKLERTRFSYTVFNLTIEEQVELAASADELGYDAAWFGEHVVMPVGAPSASTTSCFTAMRSGAPATSRSRRASIV